VESLRENTVLRPFTASVPYLYRAGWHIISNCAKRDANVHLSRFLNSIFSCGAAAQRGPWPPHSWGW